MKIKNDKTKWYYIRQILIGVLLILFVRQLFWNNFYRHGLYYTEHTPHDEGYYSELVVFMQHFENIPIKGKMYYENNSSNDTFYSTNGKYKLESGNGKIFFYNIDRKITYSLNYKGYIYAYDFDHDYKDGEDMTKAERAEFEAMLADFLEPAKKATTKPLINLQWLFDKIYEGRFVDE